MKSTAHILATVRKPELLDAALLLFRTLRTGFPTARVRVWGNNLQGGNERAVQAACYNVGAEYTNIAGTSHDAWIEELVHGSLEPFWLCDTDIIFWEKVEGWFTETPNIKHQTPDNSQAPSSKPLFAGRYEPEFLEEWTRTRHMRRIHTALMWINPARTRAAMRAWMAKIPAPWGHSAQFPFIRQHFVPLAGELPMFYDTCAGLYHAIGGLAHEFTDEQNAAFEHLHCATYADVIKLEGLREAHELIYRNPTLAKGMQGTQNAYYRKQGLEPLTGNRLKAGLHT